MRLIIILFLIQYPCFNPNLLMVYFANLVTDYYFIISIQLVYEFQ